MVPRDQSTLPERAENNAGEERSIEERYIKAILDSSGFQRAPTARSLLLYLWEHRGEAISEYAIATEALGRKSEFDTKMDASVRVQIARLRQKLKEFYETEGKTCPLVISIPLGGHELQFRLDRETSDGLGFPEAPVPPVRTRNVPVWLLGAGVILLAFVCAFQFIQNERLSAVAQKTIVPAPPFWQRFVGNGKPMKLFLATPVFFEWGGTTIKLRDTVVNDFSDLDSSAELKSYSKRWGPPTLMQNYNVAVDAFAALKLSQFLQGSGILLSFGGTRELSVESLAENNIVLLGTPWITGKYTKPLQDNPNFYYTTEYTDQGERHPILNHAPRSGEPARYENKAQSDVRRTSFGLIAVLPSKGSGARILSLTERPPLPLVSFLSAPASLDLLDKAWRQEGSPEYFEMVVGAEMDRENVLRTWPAAIRAISLKPTPSGKP